MLSDAVARAVAGQAVLVLADSGRSMAETLAALRITGVEDATLLLILPTVAAIDRAMLIAALGPLAIELAPRRITALDVADGADIAAIIAAATYLVAARSTTGQSLRIG